jgi:hypothetical protein
MGKLAKNTGIIKTSSLNPIIKPTKGQLKQVLKVNFLLL